MHWMATLQLGLQHNIATCAAPIPIKSQHHLDLCTAELKKSVTEEIKPQQLSFEWWRWLKNSITPQTQRWRPFLYMSQGLTIVRKGNILKRNIFSPYLDLIWGALRAWKEAVIVSTGKLVVWVWRGRRFMFRGLHEPPLSLEMGWKI